eukprot:8328-Heterococcus_DN1.PRE.2
MTDQPSEVEFGPKTLFKTVLPLIAKLQKILYEKSKDREGRLIGYKEFFHVFRPQEAAYRLLREAKITSSITSSTLMKVGTGVCWEVVTPHETDRGIIKTPGVWRVLRSRKQAAAEKKAAEDRAAADIEAVAEREAFLNTLPQEVPAPGSMLRKDQAMRRMEIRVCDPQQLIKIDKLYNTKNFGGISLEHYADTQNGSREAFTRIIISKQFKLNLLTGEDADNFRREIEELRAEQAADSESEGDACSGDQASIDSQCANLRIATAYAVSDGDEFFHLAKSLEHVRGTFESAAKAKQALKSSLTKGLTEGELKDKIVEQANELADVKRDRQHFCDKATHFENICKRAKLVTSDEEEDQEPWMGWNPADVVGSD